MTDALMVLGMHRSGTSLMARSLQEAGVDIGARLLGGSAGNPDGHFEDAVVVEHDERLLAALGRRWDDLPIADERDLPASERAAFLASTAGYLVEDRARRGRWAMKDPRLCLFASTWRAAIERAQARVAAVLVVRHPVEVARSLASRDGLPFAQGWLLWTQYVLASLRGSDGLPRRVVSYDALMASPGDALARVAALPGWEDLRPTEAHASLARPERRHHRVDPDLGLEDLPELVIGLWRMLARAAAGDGVLKPEAGRAASAEFAGFDALANALASGWRAREQALWSRVARAEGQTAAAASGLDLAPLSEALGRQHAEVIHAISHEIHLMQATTAAAMQQLGAQEGGAAAVAALDARLLALPGDIEAATAPALLTALDHAAERITAEVAIARDAAADGAIAVAALRDAVERGDDRLEARLAALDGVPSGLAALAPRLEVLQGRLHEAVSPLRAALAGIGATLEARAEAQAAATVAGHASLAASLESLRGALDETRASLRERDAALAATLASADRRDAEHRAALASAREDAARREQALGEALEAARRERDSLRQALEAETASVKQHKDLHMQQQHEHAATLEHLQSELARRDDELHALRHEVEQLRESHLTLQQVLESASWRWTRPLRAAARLLRGDWRQDSSARLGKMVRDVVARAPGLSEDARSALIERSLNLGHGAHVPALLPDRHLAPHLALAEPVDGLPDVFVWAVIDWHFRVQRPQHLARALAERGHRVFYMSNNFVDAAEPGFHVQPLDADGRLFQVHLALAGAPAIYYGLPSDAQADALHASLATLLAWTCTPASLSLVQHAYWTPLVRSVPNARVVYDCMDHHAGFEDNAPAVLQAEQALVADADLVIVTSAWLHDEIAPKARATALVRNAGEYGHFRAAPAEVFRDGQGRRVIGYYGAIAEWFDLALVRAVALAQPDALVLLVGNDTAGAAAALADLPNVRLVGEVPYADLPYWLHGFDVALLPFKVIPLTLATNPVKVYEYLAAGVPVVAVDLPEMAQFDGLVRVAGDHAGFVAAVADALAAPGDAGAVAARQAFAAGQTWAHRARALDEALDGIREPRVSVIVLTYNNLAFTDACLFSIEAYSDYPDLEVIVVDNASSDGSREWLQRWVDEPSKAGHARRLILNDDNLGFAAGNNVGLAAATGEVLVMLNNDTYATPGWVRGLCNHLRRDPGLGLVGPVTNNIGNEAKLDIHYADMVEMIRLAGQHTRRHAGRRLEIPTVAFFCVAMPRSVYERVGGLDEAFGVGFFEDDDYCRRVAQAGWRVACADDVFIHHHLSASFDKLKAEAKQALFERNKAIFEAKWGPWQPHVYRARA